MSFSYPTRIDRGNPPPNRSSTQPPPPSSLSSSPFSPQPLQPIQQFQSAQSSQPIQKAQNLPQDPFLTQHFYPLEQANLEILAALRADEASPDADLYRRITHCSHSYSDSASATPTTGTISGTPPFSSSSLNTVQNATLPILRQGHEYRISPETAASLLSLTTSTTSSSSTTLTTTLTTTTTTNQNKNSIPLHPQHIHGNFIHDKSIPLPQYMVNILSTQTQLYSLMGIFPEAGLVWVSVDDTLYLWEYQHRVSGSSADGVYQDLISHTRDDFVSFTLPSRQCIVSVGLAPPKPGVFKQVVEWCLIITTPEQVILCALARQQTIPSTHPTTTTTVILGEDRTRLVDSTSVPTSLTNKYDSALRLIPTRYIIPTDSVPILSVTGTRDGRIFLGGYDGCLYEMAYEGIPPLSNAVQKQPSFQDCNYDGDEEEDPKDNTITSFLGTENDPSKILWSETKRATSHVLSGTKRALSTIVFGPNVGEDSYPRHWNRPQKCRKVNITSSSSSIVTALVPSFILHAVSSVASVVGSGTLPSIAGPITQLTLDHHRHILYALTQRGYIHAFDLSVASSSHSSATGSNSQPKLACTVDIPKSARRYLDNVARARPFPPSLSFSSDADSIAAIVYPGGASAASAGVGGMDMARQILKTAEDFRSTMNGQANATSTRGNNPMNWYGRKRKGADGGVLHPVSIHVVSPSESKLITLVAITSGGLRCYLSVLPNVGTAMNMSSNGSGNRGFHSTSSRPGKRFTLAHIRSAPPFKTTAFHGLNDLSIDLSSNQGPIYDSPGIQKDTLQDISINPGLCKENKGDAFITRGLYADGTTLLAIDCGATVASTLDKGPEIVGDAIMCLTPDVTLRIPASANVVSVPNEALAGSGLAEIVSLPASESLSNNRGSSILGGGHVWDLVYSTIDSRFEGEWSTLSSIWRLIAASTTPSDAELSLGLMSPYVAPSRKASPTHEVSMSGSQSLSKLNLDSAVVPNQRRNGTNYGPNGLSIGAQYNSQNFLLSAVQGLAKVFFQSPFYSNGYASENSTSDFPRYKISERTGCSRNGFSLSASVSRTAVVRPPSKPKLANEKSFKLVRSERLSTWLLRPAETALPEFSLLHPFLTAEKPFIVVLNSGGVHILSRSSPLAKFKEILASGNLGLVGKDERIKSFFINYGFMEACVMCLTIAISLETDDVRAKAVQAALSFAHRPLMVRMPSASWGVGVPLMQADSERQVFQPSFIYKALVALASRLLRPIWYKPAVVVTEGKVVPSPRVKDSIKYLPAKVELLLDETTLQEIRQPLVSLQNLMKAIFSPAISAIPGSATHDTMLSELVSIDFADTIANDTLKGLNLLTRAMKYQSNVSVRNAAPRQLSEKEIQHIAKVTEERKIHALYRLLSRSVQLLSLISHLRRAHAIPELPEVEFGLLHGLTYCQLVTTKTAHERIETVLSSLLSSHDVFSNDTDMSSVESSNVASLLATQCYLFFSAGSRYTFLGFKAASVALSTSSLSFQRREMTERAGLYFCQAARRWTNSKLISGLLLPADFTPSQLNNQMASEKLHSVIADRALEFGSPLARAASVLMKLEHVSAIVDICLICAKNFGVSNTDIDDEYEYLGDNEESKDMFDWEKDLYHKTSKDIDRNFEALPMENTMESSSNTPNTGATIAGMEASQTNALMTCYSVLFHHLTNLLISIPQSPKCNSLADQMISTASASSDIKFLHMLYAHLLKIDHVDRLLRIQSMNLANWIKDDLRDMNLLWRHYTLHGFNSMAGQVMLERARCPLEERLSLEDRIEALTRAVNSFTAALESDLIPVGSEAKEMSRGEISRLIVQVNELIEVAVLQRRTMSYIMNHQGSFEIDPKKMESLSFSLLGVSDLYNDYAVPFSLYDICLLILHMCRYDDPTIISTLWKSIICEEIMPCKTRSRDVYEYLDFLKSGSMLEQEIVVLVEGENNEGAFPSLIFFENGEWFLSLKDRIVALGKELYGKGTDFTFPTVWIAETLNSLQEVFVASSDKRGGVDEAVKNLWSVQVLTELRSKYPQARYAL